MIIENSERLSFALMTANDAELLFNLDQDTEVMQFINGGVLTSWEDIQNVYLPRMESYTNADKGWGLWKVVLQNTEQFIGWILVRPMNFFSEQPDFENLELGWRFSRLSWGKGYATEAATAVINALIKNAVCTKISAIADEENLASINIMKKIGLQYIKTYLHQDPLFSSEVVYYELEV